MGTEGREKELREQLEKIFTPKHKDCYQRALYLPALDEIQLSADAVTLVVFRPSETALQAITQWHNQETNKNRVCFVTGDASTYERVLDAASRLKAIGAILEEFRTEGRPDADPQVQEAFAILDKLRAKLYMAVKSTFLTLHYPARDGLTKLDMDFQYTEHKFEAEEQVRRALEASYKYTTDVSVDGTFRKRVENKLWPKDQQEVPWAQIKANAAQDSAWVWHPQNALDSLRAILVQRDQWRATADGKFVDRGPFPQPQTEVRVQVLRRDDETGKVTLKVTPVHGDRVYMETGGGEVTEASKLIEGDTIEVEGLEYSFRAVDSQKTHEAGAASTWTNTVTIKHRFFQDGDNIRCELKAAPPSTIKYTTDGSNPAQNGGAYTEPFIVPKGARFVQAVPTNGKGPTETIPVPAEPEKVTIDPNKPYFWKRSFQKDSTMETYDFLGLCKKHDAYLGGVGGTIARERRWVEIQLDDESYQEVAAVERALDTLQTLLPNGAVSLKVTSLNLESGQKLQDLVAELKTTLKPGEIKEAEPKK